MTGIAILGLATAFALLYSGWKGYDPRSLFTSVFTGQPPTPLGGTSTSGSGAFAGAVGNAIGNAVNIAGQCVDKSELVSYSNGTPGGVWLTPAAMDAFKRAEQRAGQKIILTGSWRSCALQQQLYAQDPNRYAKESFHTAGQAIDVNMANNSTNVHAALLASGWCFPRSDEPWHYSFGGCG